MWWQNLRELYLLPISYHCFIRCHSYNRRTQLWKLTRSQSCQTLISLFFQFLLLSLAILKYSQTWVNDHLRIATTCLQRPLFWSPNLRLHNINLPLNNDHLSTTATNLGSRGWSLYKGLTVQSYTFKYEISSSWTNFICRWPLLFAALLFEVLTIHTWF